jgi:hypothetical protein
VRGAGFRQNRLRGESRFPYDKPVAADNTAFVQRVRIGLTGLAFVFVVVLLAAVFVRPSDEEPITANSIERQLAPDSASPANDSEPKEPLAELGVAPGNAEGNGVKAAAPLASPARR